MRKKKSDMESEIDANILALFSVSLKALRTRSPKKLKSYRLQAGILRERLKRSDDNNKGIKLDN